jgi:hypothetical protein
VHSKIASAFHTCPAGIQYRALWKDRSLPTTETRIQPHMLTLQCTCRGDPVPPPPKKTQVPAGSTVLWRFSVGDRLDIQFSINFVPESLLPGGYVNCSPEHVPPLCIMYRRSLLEKDTRPDLPFHSVLCSCPQARCRGDNGRAGQAGDGAPAHPVSLYGRRRHLHHRSARHTFSSLILAP